MSGIYRIFRVRGYARELSQGEDDLYIISIVSKFLQRQLPTTSPRSRLQRFSARSFIDGLFALVFGRTIVVIILGQSYLPALFF